MPVLRDLCRQFQGEYFGSSFLQTQYKPQVNKHFNFPEVHLDKNLKDEVKAGIFIIPITKLLFYCTADLKFYLTFKPEKRDKHLESKFYNEHQVDDKIA